MQDKRVLDLLRLQTLVLCDAAATDRETLYLVTNTSDNWESLARRAVERVEAKRASWVLLGNAEDIHHGYPGSVAWGKSLIPRLPPETALGMVHIPGDLNTYTEMDHLAAWAKAHAPKTLTLVTAPFHQLRVFLTAVAAFRRHGIAAQDIRLYNLPGAALPWHETARHSQGTTVGTRVELIDSELGRIERYTAKGDLATAEEAMAYLRARDA